MKKKTLSLRKEVVADLSGQEMSQLMGGAANSLLHESCRLCIIKPSDQTNVNCEAIPPTGLGVCVETTPHYGCTTANCTTV